MTMTDKLPAPDEVPPPLPLSDDPTPPSPEVAREANPRDDDADAEAFLTSLFRGEDTDRLASAFLAALTHPDGLEGVNRILLSKAAMEAFPEKAVQRFLRETLPSPLSSPPLESSRVPHLDWTPLDSAKGLLEWMTRLTLSPLPAVAHLSSESPADMLEGHLALPLDVKAALPWLGATLHLLVDPNHGRVLVRADGRSAREPLAGTLVIECRSGDGASRSATLEATNLVARFDGPIRVNRDGRLHILIRASE